MDYGKLFVVQTCFGFLSTSGPTVMRLRDGKEIHFTKFPGPTTNRYEMQKHAEMAVRILMGTWPQHVLQARAIPIEQAVKEVMAR